MAQVDPDQDEEAEVRADYGGVEVVEGFRGLGKGRSVQWVLAVCNRSYGYEEVAYVVSDVDRYSHFREVKAIAQCYEQKRHHMM